MEFTLEELLEKKKYYSQCLKMAINNDADVKRIASYEDVLERIEKRLAIIDNEIIEKNKKVVIRSNNLLGTKTHNKNIKTYKLYETKGKRKYVKILGKKIYIDALVKETYFDTWVQLVPQYFYNVEVIQ